VLLKLILAVTKMKYKQGKGDPQNMHSFMVTNKLNPNMIKRYVGNRFHILFELCANIYFMRNKLIEFFETTCSKSYSSDIAAALKTEIVGRELLVGGLFGKCLTDPLGESSL